MSTRQFEFYIMKAHSVCKICEEQIDKGTKAVRLPDVHVSLNRKSLSFHRGCFKVAIDPVLRNEKENKELDDEV